MATDSLAFSNPSVPNDVPDDHAVSLKKLSNSDFRNIINTPRPSNWGKDDTKATSNMQPQKNAESADKKKKLKKHKPKKPEVAVEKTPKTVGTQYRDRARERREGKTGEGEKLSPGRAEKQETRRQQIEESKYLGGDINHTHLVKGLDYVLLEKARYDIDTKQRDTVTKVGPAERTNIERSKAAVETVVVQSAMCKKLLRFLFEEQLPKRNHNFFPGRMAYRIDLEDEFGEFDVPTTIHRSVMDCGRMEEASSEMSSNQKVIHSLTNILSYLRGERKQAKKAKQRGRVDDKGIKDIAGKNFDMFGDAVDNDMTKKASRDDRKRNQHDNKHQQSRDIKPRIDSLKDRDIKGKYFDKPEDEPAGLNPLEQMKQTIKNMEKKSGDKKSHDEQLFKYLKQKTNTTGYDECYPEVIESFDAMGDSDDEADYTKMDMGNKKGPVGRWDFETQEEYNKYMSNKEALPKAAFQYGVKMADGRKTRRIHNKDDKAAYEKQWKQIQDMWKYKTGEPETKKAKY